MLDNMLLKVQMVCDTCKFVEMEREFNIFK